MRGSKILVSREELRVLQEQEFFQLKRKTTEKIFALLAATVQQLKASEVFGGIRFPDGTDVTTGKISRGENYQGQPYQVLDFPRFSHPDKLLMFRTIVWWGHEVSNVLVISGSGLAQAIGQLTEHLALLQAGGVWLGLHSTPWQHHYTPENSVQLKKMTPVKIHQELDHPEFLKLGRRLPIHQINRCLEFSVRSFELLSAILPKKS